MVSHSTDMVTFMEFVADYFTIIGIITFAGVIVSMAKDHKIFRG